jgi:hypothetical protein
MKKQKVEITPDGTKYLRFSTICTVIHDKSGYWFAFKVKKYNIVLPIEKGLGKDCKYILALAREVLKEEPSNSVERKAKRHVKKLVGRKKK